MARCAPPFAFYSAQQRLLTMVACIGLFVGMLCAQNSALLRWGLRMVARW